MKEVATTVLGNDEEPDCSNVVFPDIDSIADIMQPAIEMVEHVTEIYLEDNQFDILRIYGEAQKLGLDIGDLNQYGFDFVRMEPTVESYDELHFKLHLFFENVFMMFASQIGMHYQTALCHPAFKKHVAPRVQLFWDIWPINKLFLWYADLIDCIIICCVPCSCCCVLPIKYCCIVPSNLCCECCLWNPILCIFYITLLPLAACTCCTKMFEGL